MPSPLNPQMNPVGPGPASSPAPGSMQGPPSFMQRFIFNKLYQSNPQFRQFADSMQGKTPEQAFQEHGLDYSQFQNINETQIKNMLGF